MVARVPSQCRWIERFLGRMACWFLFGMLYGGAWSNAAAADDQAVTLGVLAIRAKAETLDRWQPLADYLSEALPGYRFRIEALDYRELDAALQRQQLDFVLTNPSYYIYLRSHHRLSSPLATLVEESNGQPVTAYGGIIVTRADRHDINTLQDLRGKTVAVVNYESLGGYQAQAREFSQAGIDLQEDVTLISVDPPHSRAAAAVLDGRADAGFMRSGMLEELESGGVIAPQTLKIVNRQSQGGYPAAFSTRLYPEWPFLALPRVEEELGRGVAAALLRLDHHSGIVRKSRFYGFSLPSDYTPVEDLLRELRLPPFDAPPEFSSHDVWTRYRWPILLATVGAFTSLLLLILLLGYNHRLDIARREAEGSNRRLQEAQQLGRIGSWLWDVAEDRVSWSEELYRIVGRPQDDTPIRYGDMADYYSPEELARLMAAVEEALASGRDYELELRLQRRDGQERVCIARGAAERDAAGEIVRLYGTLQDITERHRAAVALRESEERYHNLFELTDVVMLVVDPTDGLIHEANAAACRFYGYAREELLGKPVQLINTATAAELQEIFSHVSTMQSCRFALQHRLADGTVRDVEACCTPVKIDGKAMLHSVVTDVTDRRRSEEQLLAAKTAADTANRAKSEFLANMSHEIRTPMNGIIGMAELLGQTPLSLEQREYLEGIEISSGILLQLINDVLDLSRIEAGKVDLEEVDFAPQQVLEEVIKALSPRLRQKGLSVRLELEEELPESVCGDPLRLRQVLLNLLANAVKFTEEGEIAVQVGPGAASEGRTPLRFSVRDTGIGMTPEVLGRIFSPFEQGDSSTTRRFGGSGLGLAISRKLVELMGGELTAVSTPGQGSVFHLAIPFAKAEQLRPPRRPQPLVERSAGNGRALQILVVEDNDMNRLFVTRVLTKLGHRCVEARNGHEALNHWSAGGVDCILMDIQMPEVSGTEVMETIRRRESGSRTPIIALTANALKGDREAFLAAGFDGYLAKPVGIDALAEALEQVVSAPVAAGGGG